MEDFKARLAEMRSTFPSKKTERRRLTREEVILQKKLETVRVKPNVIRQRWKGIK